jgi:predicted ABC-type transport system involved in lysophospholipase L1 biosynthesis ATPase subunit
LQRSGIDERLQHTYDIFEGTEQIQQLVIARAISGLRIE